ncbi:MAG: BON domain-containing protein [Alphaproteobacteria bacterium]
MRKPSQILAPMALIALMGGSLTGCVETIVGGAATVGLAAAQERSVGDAVDDSLIGVQINSLLLDENIDLFAQVSSEVHEGRVLLTGAVDTAEFRVKAARLVWSIEGVQEVINEIEVNPDFTLLDSAKDTWITTKIRARLLTDPDVVDINYTIETVNGVVYLLGIAQSDAELKRTTWQIQQVSGVVRIVSHVVLKNDPRR